MESLKISKEKAIELYPTAGKELQSIFEETFGKKTFLKDIKDMVKSFEDAMNLLPKNDIDLQDYLNILYAEERLGIKFNVHLKNDKKRIIIAKALNEGWIPNWGDALERKWFPYFSFGSGFGFSGSNYDDWDASTAVGSRLCFRSKELSDYFGKQFIDLHESVLTFKENK